MIYVQQRPQGHKLSDTEVPASISDVGGAVAVSVGFPHGLEEGDYIYVNSEVDSYSGFKRVQYGNPTQFTFITEPSDLPVAFVKDADITYQVSVLEHGVLAVHNPIVYIVYNSLYPTNSDGESYYPSAVTSHEDYNGYTKLILSGNLEDATALAWIVINDIPYQIITVISDSIVVVNHAYDATDTFPGPVVKYYNNYCINVNVYCGYSPSHPWYSYKPYELAATLKLIPDVNGIVKFSISEIVKSYITTRNKLDLDTLPNNTDFTSNFYIEYFESYDESDGFEITTVTTTPIADDFQGMAVNAQMPFKSKDISWMSQYVAKDSSLAKWLTLQDTMTWIVGKYLDISFINAPADIELDLYINGEIEPDVLGNVGTGVIRVPLNFDEAGEYCLQVFRPAVPARSPSSIVVGAMLPCPGGDWIGSTVVVGCCGQDSGYLSDSFVSDAGVDHTFTFAVNIIASTGTPLTRIRIALLDDDCNVLGYADKTYITSGVKTDTVVVNPTSNGTKVAVWVRNNTLIYSKSYTLNSLSFDGSPGAAASAYTEEFCLTVVEECDNTIVSDNIRLLEDGDYRILE